MIVYHPQFHIDKKKKMSSFVLVTSLKKMCVLDACFKPYKA